MTQLLKCVTLSLVLVAGIVSAQERTITLASTTSTEQSGFFAQVLPKFKAQTGIEVRVIAVGTGQAFDIARRGDADALLVHDRRGEDAFVEEGFGLERRDVMYNDFVIVGPSTDPAGVAATGTVVEAFARIARSESIFTSRGDDSGTHRAELRHWREAGVEVGRTRWYRELGAGMGPTLNTSADLGAYTLSDRASWASFRNRRGLVVLLQGDPALLNPYGSLLVDPARHPHLKHRLARTWHDWLVSEAGQRAIAAFRIDDERVFLPAAAVATHD
ncbi:substrate-binding domain-containing protein [Alkalisalibacterium limincola]|uniref:Sulfate transporter n=1 Tax=Alkalisalibacterium limincola TaxID=2699169 RepID=A0A5C8KR47_9GAMM|nr:substrate-binding domain-containing protein [Alkalisalibacterium limincola]TXK62346.1 sulfate transporter [Alkalisalibacterium limincola]